MASKGQAITVYYTAWDNVAGAGKTGDVANHTLRWLKDGTSAAPTNSPSEVDATNAPGLYKLTLTSTECTCWCGTLAGKSSTSGVSILPMGQVIFENLPTADPAAANGLLTFGSSTGQLNPNGGKMPVDLTQALSAARDISAVADTSLTLNDVYHCAIAAAAGKETVVGTAYTVKTPSTGTVLRTFTLDSATAPTSRT